MSLSLTSTKCFVAEFVAQGACRGACIVAWTDEEGRHSGVSGCMSSLLLLVCEIIQSNSSCIGLQFCLENT